MKKKIVVLLTSLVVTSLAPGNISIASEGELNGDITLLMTNDWVDENKALGAEFTKVIAQYEEEHPNVKKCKNYFAGSISAGYQGELSNSGSCGRRS